MPEICSQLCQVGLDIAASLIAVEHRAHGQGMAEVMQSGGAAPGPRSQLDPLSELGELPLDIPAV
jgi:hypothetical protein